MSYLDHPPGPQRDAYIAGATAEANLRDAPRNALPRDSREFLDYLDSLAKYDPDRLATPGTALAAAAYVFASAVTRAERRTIRRALRNRSPR